MAQISIIKKSDISEARRFDAEYFKLEYLVSLNMIKKHDFLPNSKISIIKSGTTPKNRDENLKEGTVLLKTGNIRNNILFYEKEKFFHISQKIDDKMHTTKLKEKDVLLNIVGATTDVIGRTSIILGDFPKSNITQAMAFCRIKNSKIKPEFLFIFFQTKFGKNQTKRLARPTGQFNLNLREVGQFLIPILNNNFQFQIEKIVKEAHQKQTLSKKLYQEAEQLLLEELDLVDYQPKHTLTFETTKKEVQQATRFDAEYFQPKYAKIIEKIENYEGGCVNLGNENFAELKRGSLIPDKFYTKKKGLGYIRGADFSSGILNKEKLIYISRDFETHTETQVFKNDIVFSLIGSVGASAFVSESFDNYFISNNTGKISLKTDFNSIVLQIFLQSIAGKLQFEKEKMQTAQPKISTKEIGRFKIPLIKPQIQTQIAEKIKESHTLRKESKELLEVAKKKVEEEIEK